MHKLLDMLTASIFFTAILLVFWSLGHMNENWAIALIVFIWATLWSFYKWGLPYILRKMKAQNMRRNLRMDD